MKSNWLKRLAAWSMAAAMLLSMPGLTPAADTKISTAAASDRFVAPVNPTSIPETPTTPELDSSTSSISIDDAQGQGEPAIQLGSSTLTLEEGQTSEITVEGTGVTGDYRYEVSELNDTSAAGFTETQQGAEQSLTVTGNEAGSNLCTVTMRDADSGKIVASRSITVKTTDGEGKGGNESAYLKASKYTFYVAEGTSERLAVRVVDSDSRYTIRYEEYGSYYTSTWGGWNADNVAYIDITGEELGTEKVSIELLDAGTDEESDWTVVNTITVTVKVVPENTINTSWSSDTIQRTQYKDMKVAFYGITSGTTYTATIGNAKKVRIAWLSKKTKTATLRIRGLQKGSTTITIALKKDGKTLRTKKVTVTVRDLGVIDYAYRFYNSASDFGIADSSSYVYPYSAFSRMFGNNARARQLWKTYGKGWNGDCYGMVTTSGLMYNQNMPASFKSGAIRAYELGIGSKSSYSGLTLKAFIQSMMWGQLSEAEQKRTDQRMEDKINTYNTIVDLTSRGVLVKIGLHSLVSGHAVLGYKAVISGSTAKVYYYDPNESNTPQYITFRKSGGNYKSFTFGNAAYRVEYDRLSYTTYNEYAYMWSHRGSLNGVSTSLVTSDSDSFEIRDSKGKMVAVVKDGHLTSKTSGVVQITPEAGDISHYDTALYLPTGTYTIRNTAPNRTFAVSMTNVDHSAQVQTGASKVTFTVTDRNRTNRVSIAGAKGTSYRIRLSSSAAGEPETLTFAGTGTVSTIHAGTTSGTVTKQTNAVAVDN